MKWDIFLSYSSDDKYAFVDSLANALCEIGMKVWYDSTELKIGMSIRSKIDYGLSNSRFVAIILSKTFFKKKWTKWELDGIIARLNSGKNEVLPIWHEVTTEEVLAFSPSLADRVALNSSMSVDIIARKIAEVVRPDLITNPQKGILLEELLTLSMQPTGVDPYRVESLLKVFADEHKLILEFMNSGIEQEWGVGGRHVFTYKLNHWIDGTISFVKIQFQWDTTSDDSMDYGQPTVINIMGIKNNYLSTECIKFLDNAIRTKK